MDDAKPTLNLAKLPSQPSEANLLKLEKLKRLEQSTLRVLKLLRMYPDYSKVEPEYIAGMAETFAQFSDEVQECLLSPVRGLPSVSRYLPVPFDVLRLGSALAASLFGSRAMPEKTEKVISLDERRRVGEKMKKLLASLQAQ